MRKTRSWFYVLTFVASSALGQGFVNLDFESARIVPVSTNVDVYISATDALPGWSAFVGTNQLSEIVYNLSGNGSGPYYVGLYGSNSAALSGNFSVLLDAGSISQMGLIPTNAESLLFEAHFLTGSSSLSVSVNGQNLSYTAISTLPKYIVYGADISAFAGQMGTLTFSAGEATLDDIQFSSTPVPEPGGLVWLALGSGVLVYVIRRRHR